MSSDVDSKGVIKASSCRDEASTEVQIQRIADNSTSICSVTYIRYEDAAFELLIHLLLQNVVSHLNFFNLSVCTA
jgi:hypothetical protein